MLELIVSLLGRDRAWRLGRALYMRARGEKATNNIDSNGEAKLIAAILREPRQRPAVLFDVGANRGEWTDAALGLAGEPAPTIHMFEAAPEAAEHLRSKFAGRATVTLHALALSDREGTAPFAVVGPTAGTNSLELDTHAQGVRTIDVRVETGAAVAAAAAVEFIDLLKIDTEGHDYNVIKGFEPLLAERRIGIVQFEYNSRWLAAHRSMQDVFRLAALHGYRVGRVGMSGIELFDDWNAECDRYFEDNYALVSPAAVRAPLCSEMHWGISNTVLPGPR